MGLLDFEEETCNVRVKPRIEGGVAFEVSRHSYYAFNLIYVWLERLSQPKEQRPSLRCAKYE